MRVGERPTGENKYFLGGSLMHISILEGVFVRQSVGFGRFNGLEYSPHISNFFWGGKKRSLPWENVRV